MHNETTKALYDMFPPEDKNDFYPAYFYLKYIHHFVKHVNTNLGVSTRELSEVLGEDVEAMISSMYDTIGAASSSTDTSIYHAKVLKLQDAVKIVTQKENLEIIVSENVMPYKMAKDIILNNPESISVGKCACRMVLENPCIPEPMEVCIFVGDPAAAFIRTHNQIFRESSQEEAVGILEKCHQDGFVHTAWFKKELGKRFAMICNCCSCCCQGIKMWNILEGSVPILSPSGYVAQVSDDCIGCQTCIDESACHFNAISMDDAKEKAVVNFDKCMGCGVCETVCPENAISLKRDPAKGEPLDLDELISQKG